VSIVNSRRSRDLYSIFSQGFERVVAAQRRTFGTAYDSYRDQWSRAERREILTPVPLQLDIDLASRCNMSCRYCNGMPYILRGEEYRINLQLLRLRLDEAVGRGIRSLNFGNGAEPLLTADEMFPLISHARSLGVIDLFVHSNGLLLSRRMSRKIIEANVTFLCISLDALREETYSRYGRKGFPAILENIDGFLEQRRLAKSDTPGLRISFLPTTDNIGELDDFIYQWKDKADKIDIQSVIDLDKSFNLDRIPGFIKFSPACVSPWTRMAIWPNNSYGVCCQPFCLSQSGGMNNGSLADKSIAQAWQSSLMNRVRTGLISDDAVTACVKCLDSYYRYDEDKIATGDHDRQ